MKAEFLSIGPTPAVVYGPDANRVFLCLHGQCGHKEEAAFLAQTAVPLGFQVLGIDLPEHGGRTDAAKLVPWDVERELHAVLLYLHSRWQQLALHATSIGAYFGLTCMNGFEKCLLVSPLLDMQAMICSMMAQAGVTEAQLASQKEIVTRFGATLSWDYLCWARQHPVTAPCPDTQILYAEGDQMIPRPTVEDFADRFHCGLTVMPGGEHWFHTEEELAFLKDWQLKQLTVK